jgi:DNA-binding transcriptional regulator YdaS (Cro superfamily)
MKGTDMTLEEYLKEYGAAKRLAQAMEVAPPEISKIKNGKKPVSFHHAALIEKATNGQVRMENVLTDQKLKDLATYIRSNVSQQTTS